MFQKLKYIPAVYFLLNWLVIVVTYNPIGSEYIYGIKGTMYSEEEMWLICVAIIIFLLTITISSLGLGIAYMVSESIEKLKKYFLIYYIIIIFSSVVFALGLRKLKRLNS